MGNSVPITTIVREVPLNRLVSSKDNVRKTGSDNAVEELAASILAHGLLQNLTVKPVLDDQNRETGKFQVTAGGRRLAALKLLATQKKIAKTIPITCNVREDGSAKELSLVENVQRVSLHPADQFEAFRSLHDEEGLGAEDIAARFGVTVRTVRERLKLGAVSPKLMGLYREAELTLDQIMAFAVIDDPARQEEVWEGLVYDRSPHSIRRQLLQGHVPAQDKRALFVGFEAYEAAGGGVLRDLFEADGGGYLTDPGLLDRLARAKLEAAAEEIRTEGWKWVEVALDFPHGHGFRRVFPRDVDLPEEEVARLESIEAELDQLSAESEATEEGNPEREAQIAQLTAEYDLLDAKSRVFDPADVERAGVIVSLDGGGELFVMRGLVRPEDDRKSDRSSGASRADSAGGDGEEGPDGEEGRSGLSERLVADLTAHRTIALRDALAVFPELAHVALTHVLALEAFFVGERSETCLSLHASSVALDGYADAIGETSPAKAVAARHEAWAARMPREAQDLWAFVHGLVFSERQALLAHCVSLLVDALQRPGFPKKPGADVLATALHLDMRRYWSPTAAGYLGRVTKAQILEAVREGVSGHAVDRLQSLTKKEMAEEAEKLLANSTWLPAILRTQQPPATVETTKAAE